MNLITNNAVRWPPYKLSYDARTIQDIHSLLIILSTVPAPNRATKLDEETHGPQDG